MGQSSPKRQAGGSSPSSPAMKTHDEQAWNWVCKGFQGLTGMIGRYLKEGVAPTEYLFTQLNAVRDQLDTLIKEAHERKANSSNAGEDRVGA